MGLFCQSYSEDKRLAESLKEAKWNHHFSEYGRFVLRFSAFFCLILYLN